MSDFPLIPVGAPKRRGHDRKPGVKRAPGVRYSKRLLDDLCFYIASGESLSEACSHEGMPVLSTIIAWLNESDEAKEGDEKYGMSLAYGRAVEARTHFIEHRASTEAQKVRLGVEEKAILETRYDPETDTWRRVEVGVEVKKFDAVDRSRLAVDTDKWFLARMKPNSRGTRYGYGTASASVNINNGSGAGPTDPNAKPTFVINIINSPDAD